MARALTSVNKGTTPERIRPIHHVNQVVVYRLFVLQCIIHSANDKASHKQIVVDLIVSAQVASLWINLASKT